MSAYHSQRTSYKDRDSLVAALHAQGYSDVEVNDAAQPLVGYHSDMRNQRANVIVRRRFVGSASNDLGWEWDAKAGVFTEHISDYDKGKHNSTWLGHLKAAYAEAVDMKTARKSGLQFLSRKVVNGKVQLTFIDNRA
jgi:hypothetical protein